MRRKIRSRRGFTLVEVLAVAAVLLILLAIAIPSVMGAIDRGRHKHDAEVERAAAAALTALVQNGTLERDKTEGKYSTTVYLFDAENGRIVYAKSGFSPGGYTPYGECRTEGHQGKFLWLQYTADNEMQMYWSKTRPGGTLSHHGIQSSAAPDCPLIRHSLRE